MKDKYEIGQSVCFLDYDGKMNILSIKSGVINKIVDTQQCFKMRIKEYYLTEYPNRIFDEYELCSNGEKALIKIKNVKLKDGNNYVKTAVEDAYQKAMEYLPKDV